jgi:hypothetical protein
VVGKAVLGAERPSDRLDYKGRVAEEGEADPEDACLVLGNEGRGCLEGEPRLPRATWTREGDEPRAGVDRGEQLRKLACRRRS